MGLARNLKVHFKFAMTNKKNAQKIACAERRAAPFSEACSGTRMFVCRQVGYRSEGLNCAGIFPGGSSAGEAFAVRDKGHKGRTWAYIELDMALHSLHHTVPELCKWWFGQSARGTPLRLHFVSHPRNTRHCAQHRHCLLYSSVCPPYLFGMLHRPVRHHAPTFVALLFLAHASFAYALTGFAPLLSGAALYKR